jgi:hypothetical protein
MSNSDINVAINVVMSTSSVWAAAPGPHDARKWNPALCHGEPREPAPSVKQSPAMNAFARKPDLPRILAQRYFHPHHLLEAPGGEVDPELLKSMSQNR